MVGEYLVLWLVPFTPSFASSFCSPFNVNNPMKLSFHVFDYLFLFFVESVLFYLRTNLLFGYRFRDRIRVLQYYC